MLGGDNGPAWALWCCPASHLHLHPSTVPLSGPSWDSRVQCWCHISCEAGSHLLYQSVLGPTCPCQARAKCSPPHLARIVPQPCLPQHPPAKKMFLSAPEAVFLLPSSLCRAGFARERTGLPSPTVSAPQPGNWERVFFITNKLGVIAVSTVATPRPGEAPSHTGACRSSPMAREPRHPQPRSRPCSRQQQ